MASVKVSKILSWAAMALVIVILVLAFVLDMGWWMLVDIFFAFMMAFLHLLSVYLRRMPGIAKQLDMAALVCGGLMIVSLIVEYFLL